MDWGGGRPLSSARGETGLERGQISLGPASASPSGGDCGISDSCLSETGGKAKAKS